MDSYKADILPSTAPNSPSLRSINRLILMLIQMNNKIYSDYQILILNQYLIGLNYHL